MGLFSIFKKKNPKSGSDFRNHAERAMSEFEDMDFLGKAAAAEHKAKAAVKAKKYDEAWRLYHEQKSFYRQHANRSKFTAREMLALDASVHEQMANILRLENKHDDALVNIVYWVLAGADRPIKRHQQKLQSYFNRCKFENTSVLEATRTIRKQAGLPEFTLAQKLVSEWLSYG